MWPSRVSQKHCLKFRLADRQCGRRRISKRMLGPKFRYDCLWSVEHSEKSVGLERQVDLTSRAGKTSHTERSRTGAASRGQGRQAQPNGHHAHPHPKKKNMLSNSESRSCHFLHHLIVGIRRSSPVVSERERDTPQRRQVCRARVCDFVPASAQTLRDTMP